MKTIKNATNFDELLDIKYGKLTFKFQRYLKYLRKD